MPAIGIGKIGDVGIDVRWDVPDMRKGKILFRVVGPQAHPGHLF